MDRFNTSARTVCRWLGVNRKLLSYVSRRRSDEPIRLRLIALAAEHRRYGLPRLTVLLRRLVVEGNHKRIAWIYRAAPNVHLDQDLARQRRARISSLIPRAKAYPLHCVHLGSHTPNLAGLRLIR